MYFNMDSLTEGAQVEQWRRLFEQKRHNFEEQQCGVACQISSIEQLQGSLHQMAQKSMPYSQGRLPDFVEKMTPGLRHIESFSRAIVSAAQYSPIASLVWGGVWAVI